jgi:hypothetical protein
MWMNMEERQQPRQAPHGTSAVPVPETSEASVTQSHAEKSPAGTDAGVADGASFLLLLMLWNLV